MNKVTTDKICREDKQKNRNGKTGDKTLTNYNSVQRGQSKQEGKFLQKRDITEDERFLCSK